MQGGGNWDPTTGSETCAFAAGYAALRDGRAEQARAIFEAAVVEHGSAEAQEGLSWAARALDDGDAAIAARQAAYRLYRDANAPVAAARMAMWLAKDHDDFRGAAALANGWLARARRLLADQPLAPEHGWLPVLECWGSQADERDPEDVVAGTRRAIEVARACGDRDLELLGIAFEGLALVDAGRVEAGMARLDEAAAATSAGEFDQPIWALVVFCNLIFACERVRDFSRAAGWCETMREAAEQMRHTGSLGLCRAHLGVVLTECGDWGAAEETLERAARHFAASWPPYAAEPTARPAELRRRQGRLAEAGQLLDAAVGTPRAALVRGRCALDLGRADDGLDCAARYLRRFPETSALHRVEGLELMVRAAVAAGQIGRAREALAELEDIASRVATTPLEAAAAASRATLAAVERRMADAQAGFEDAIDLYTRAGMKFDAALACMELAEILAALGRGAAASAEAAGARIALEALGADHLARRAAALESRIVPSDRREAACEVVEGLTRRQAEVLRHVAGGATNREVAAALALSEKTVDRHLSNAFDRLGVSSRAAAVATVLERGII